jgi:fermentation-respiration switch protein FrsA (DUF1100 family)
MEQEKIIQTISNLFNGADKHNWAMVENAMAENIVLDFSSMTGESPSTKTAIQVAENWAAFLPGFDKTHHQLSSFKVTESGNIATVHYNGKADHFIGTDVWTLDGTYDTELLKTNNAWLITKHKLNFTKQSGNINLPAKAMEIMKFKAIRKVQFISEGLVLTGNLHVPPGFSEAKKYKAVVVTGSWTTVKEQMPDLYAVKLAKKGFVALTFDFRNYGASEGQPRNYEVPEMKAKDILNAANYLHTLSFIDKDNIGGLAICASSGYMALALVNGAGLKAVNFVAPWMHNTELVKMIYGGSEAVAKKIEQSDEAKKAFAETGKATYVATASTTDKEAAMFGDFDYYLNPKRGAIKEWGNQFAIMAWKSWLQFDPVQYAGKINIPVQLIHSPSAAIPMGAEEFYKNLKGTKNIIWVDKASQFDFYDQEPFTTNATNEAVKWFEQQLC